MTATSDGAGPGPAGNAPRAADTGSRAADTGSRTGGAALSSTGGSRTVPRGQVRKRLKHLPSGLVASAGLLVVGLVLGGLLRSGSGAAGVAAGVGLVAASYTVSSIVIAWADARDPRLVLPIGLMAYVVKFTLIGFVMAAIDASGWKGLAPMGVAIIVTALGWTIAQAVWTWRARIPYVEIQPPQ